MAAQTRQKYYCNIHVIGRLNFALNFVIIELRIRTFLCTDETYFVTEPKKQSISNQKEL